MPNTSYQGETAAIVTATTLAKRDCKVVFRLTFCKPHASSKQYIGANAASQWSPAPPGSPTTTCTRALPTGSSPLTCPCTSVRILPRTRARTGRTLSSLSTPQTCTRSTASPYLRSIRSACFGPALPHRPAECSRNRRSTRSDSLPPARGGSPLNPGSVGSAGAVH